MALAVFKTEDILRRKSMTEHACTDLDEDIAVHQHWDIQRVNHRVNLAGFHAIRFSSVLHPNPLANADARHTSASRAGTACERSPT